MCNEHQKTYAWYDMEQQILKCWDIISDLQNLAELFEDNDEVCNKILGLKHIYDVRFEKLWHHYERATEERFRERREQNGDNQK